LLFGVSNLGQSERKKNNSTERASQEARVLEKRELLPMLLTGLLMPTQHGEGIALRKEKALLLTFAAGQKYGVWRDATRRFCPKFSKDERATS